MRYGVPSDWKATLMPPVVDVSGSCTSVPAPSSPRCTTTLLSSPGTDASHTSSWVPVPFGGANTTWRIAGRAAAENELPMVGQLLAAVAAGAPNRYVAGTWVP